MLREKDTYFEKNKRGIALVSVISVLAVLSILAVYFLSALKLSAQKNVQYTASVRARLLARAGVHFAIAQLKYAPDGARANFCDDKTENWYYAAGTGEELSDAPMNQTSFSHASFDSLKTNILFGTSLVGIIKLKVIDAASQININDGNSNLANMLAQLPSISSSMANSIVANQPYIHKEQIKNISSALSAAYDDFKDYITIESWQDNKATLSYNTTTYATTFTTRSPINVNTASLPVLRAVLQPLLGTSLGSEVATALEAATAANPFYSWQQFDTFIDSLVPTISGFNQSDAERVKDNANPNRVSPSTGATTEFCFSSGGYYVIESLGQIQSASGKMIARNAQRALVKIFDIEQHTSKRDFRDEDTNNNGSMNDTAYGEGGDFDGNGYVDHVNYSKVTWLDSCPINEADDNPSNYVGHNYLYSNNVATDTSPFVYRSRPNAIKLGFWDNFDEDSQNNSSAQSRAWWANALSYNFSVSDAQGYEYQSGDYSEHYSALIGQSWATEGLPPENRLHAHADDVITGDWAYGLDGVDNELWQPGSGAPLYQVTGLDFSKYILSAQGYGSGFSAVNTYNNWTVTDGFYFRIFAFDGPRSSVGTDQNFPGYRHHDPLDPSNPKPVIDYSGRGFQDVGRVTLFSGGSRRVEFYTYPIGNVWEDIGGGVYAARYFPDSHWNPAERGLYYVWGPAFYFYYGTGTHEEQYSSYARVYQRDKVYKLIVNNNRAYCSVLGSDLPGGRIDQSIVPTFNSAYEGTVELYSNANQTAWDDVRIIDGAGRYSKHFRIDNSVEVGSFHANIFLPNAADRALIYGTNTGGIYKVGSVSLDFSTHSNESSFFNNDPNINYTNIARGTYALRGPVTGGTRVFSYSIELQSEIQDRTPRVPYIDDVSLTVLSSTKVRYWHEI